MKQRITYDKEIIFQPLNLEIRCENYFELLELRDIFDYVSEDWGFAKTIATLLRSEIERQRQSQ